MNNSKTIWLYNMASDIFPNPNPHSNSCKIEQLSQWFSLKEKFVSKNFKALIYPPVVTCEIPTTSNGGVAETSPLHYQQTYTPTCKTGYELNDAGVTALTCQADKKVDPEHPGCASKCEVSKDCYIKISVQKLP